MIRPLQLLTSVVGSIAKCRLARKIPQLMTPAMWSVSHSCTTVWV